MIDAPITVLFTGILAGMLVMLSGAVSMRRIATKTSLGLGDDPRLHSLIRAQGNFIEYTPLGLITLLLVEAGGAAPATVWTLGGLLLAGRLSHAVGMLTGIFVPRSGGMVLTYASIVSGAVILLSRGLPSS